VLDFADNIALLGELRQDLQNFTNRIEEKRSRKHWINSVQQKTMTMGQYDDRAGVSCMGRWNNGGSEKDTQERNGTASFAAFGKTLKCLKKTNGSDCKRRFVYMSIPGS